MKLNMKTNESSPAKDKENQSLKLCSTAATFVETVTEDGLMKTEMKTEINISEEDVEVELDIGSNNCLYNQVSDPSPTKTDPRHFNRRPLRSQKKINRPLRKQNSILRQTIQDNGPLRRRLF